MKRKKQEDPMGKLMNVTKLMKLENVKVAPKSPPKGANKWRSQKPTFAPKAQDATDLVDGGGMQVDPARKDEYDAWRKTKMDEQNDRIAARQRKAEAARLKRSQESGQI